MDSERPAEPGSHAPHCVVWHSPGVQPPPELLAALGKRHVSIEFRTGPFAALAEVCVLDRAAHAGVAGPAHPAPAHAVILVLVQAHALAEAADVVRAVELYAPRARCWRYEPDAAVQLAAVASTDLATAPAVQAEPATTTPTVVVTAPFRRGATPPPPPVPGAKRHPAQGRPQLRLAGDGTLPARPEEDDALKNPNVREEPAAAPGADSPPGSRQVLSQDELAMLLGEDTVEKKDQSGPARRRTGDSK